MVPLPSVGRVFSGQHRVRLADVSPTGRMRLDGIARHLQDVAADDSRDSGLEGAEYWVVRRTSMLVHRFPTYQQSLAVHTWCGGVGSHWAERRTRLVDDGTVLVDAATLWVKVDPVTMRPARVGQQFIDLYLGATGGRKVPARLVHADPVSTTGTAWPLRFADFDALQHVNNAAGWEPVEEILAARPGLRPADGRPLLAEVEHHTAVERGADLTLVTEESGQDSPGVALWLVDTASGTPTVALSALVSPARSAGTSSAQSTSA